MTSVYYPIYASFRSIENYESALKDAQQNPTIVGIPIQDFLKRGSESSQSVPSSKLLQLHTQRMKKWLIYWVSYVSMLLVERLLLLKYLVPFYSLCKLSFCIWLIAPMLWLKDCKTDEDLNKELSSSSEESFRKTGCGLFYYNILKVGLRGESSLLTRLDLKQLSFFSSLTNLNVWLRGALGNNVKTDGNASSSYFDTLNSKIGSLRALSYISNYFDNNSTGEGSLVSQEYVRIVDGKETRVPSDLDEYDVVDKTKVFEESGSFDDRATTVEKRKGWFTH